MYFCIGHEQVYVVGQGGSPRLLRHCPFYFEQGPGLGSCLAIPCSKQQRRGATDNPCKILHFPISFSDQTLCLDRTPRRPPKGNRSNCTWTVFVASS